MFVYLFNITCVMEVWKKDKIPFHNKIIYFKKLYALGFFL